MFGRALRHSVRELLAVAFALLLLLLAYSHAGHLVRPLLFFCSFCCSVAERLKVLQMSGLSECRQPLDSDRGSFEDCEQHLQSWYLLNNGDLGEKLSSGSTYSFVLVFWRVTLVQKPHIFHHFSFFTRSSMATTA